MALGFDAKLDRAAGLVVSATMEETADGFALASEAMDAAAGLLAMVERTPGLDVTCATSEERS